ncbi:MAG: helix-turn-helix transcriptional regulator [Bacteroidales bacterium]|nr:helix-turn-helix transcriptional regulator [Bacteroidales bacterium]
MDNIDRMGKNISLIICNHNDEYIFKPYLTRYECHFVSTLSKIRYKLTKYHFDILLLYINFEQTTDEYIILNYIGASFPNIYSIAILKEPSYRTSHFLGTCNVKEVLAYSELNLLDSKLSNIHNTKITLTKFSIFIENHPMNMQKILAFIEQNYLNIFTITDIADYIGVTESTISREFQKNKLCSPKRLLMYFKVMHSVELLKRTGLKIKEIANLSGFTNEQRFIECFIRVFGKSPSEFRNKGIVRGVGIGSQESVIDIK